MNNSRYFSEGGQIGIETKRGCNQPCIYCCDPPGKGFRVRQRRARTVVEEFEDLIEQGIDVFHLCDSEFNVPASHALEVCNALETNAIGKRARWYTYANPFGFNVELANAMARAGCVGINFGIDHADPDMLKRLGRRHTVQDLESVAEACREAGLVAMFDMLLGGPGETRDSIRRALETLQSIGPDRVGLSCGVRLYPATPLGRFVRGQGPPRDNPNLHGTLIDNDDFLKPIFYVNEAVGDDIQRYVWSLVKGDRRFVIADPDEGNRNYNYNDNSVLEQAIRSGARGAYWHILQQLGA